ncbi:MAG: hypothetical protein CFH15_00213 [Alphaproteobacteria bacterium MarineAlpha5_Bin5]|nr:MAG: hypothetical protein CFH15_00213 [Alphaproteobacteria bacterium MarineAlpha5_Bin5]PPR51374.1 MAG: hypothetical protein CFH14_00718 [Alphaproteobacteria bacterium MarineAlpha5_Bin4]|tara:strand:+ start:1880 stop:2917 length:1038 start_codon:yes stop_codon:yes gene_type:complete
MLKKINSLDILGNENLKNSFLTATLNDINQKCYIFKGNFFADSFNYFPITENDQTFDELFKKQPDNSLNHFYTDLFYENFNNKKEKFKIYNDSFLLGSNCGDNYYSNLFEFLPRIFFIKDTKLNLIVHRNLSNKFRKLINSICSFRKIDIKFSYLDDNFYKFENSQIPQFLNLENSIKILQFFIYQIIGNNNEDESRLKIYVRREDSYYRRPVNDSDIIQNLKAKGYMILNPQQYDIIDQIKLFSKAEMIISPNGSSLANIIFCKKGTKVFEIAPKFNQSYEINLSNRYKNISNYMGLKHEIIEADSVAVEKHSPLAKKYISKNILNESNYYKNIILKLDKLNNF